MYYLQFEILFRIFHDKNVWILLCAILAYLGEHGIDSILQLDRKNFQLYGHNTSLSSVMFS